MEDKDFKTSRVPDTVILGPLERNAAFGSLSQLEQDVIYWMNVVRKDPARFYSTWVLPFTVQFPQAKGSDFKSLSSEMKSALPLFEPHAVLNKTARGHAQEIVAGKIGFVHTGIGGKSFEQRMKEAGIVNCAGENMLEGKGDGLVAVILLLIDKDVRGHGHRKLILHHSLNTIGVSFIPWKKNYILVQDFSCK